MIGKAKGFSYFEHRSTDVRIRKDQVDANRDALVTAAASLFRARGIDGVGIAEIARSAGLTHGALYAHFPSKEALVAEALANGFERSHRAMLQSAGGKAPSYADLLDFLLSPELRDGIEAGCPITASASEIGRQSLEVSGRFTAGVKRMISVMQAALGKAKVDQDRRQLAITAIAAEIGAITIARACAKSDRALSEEVVEAVRSVLGSLDAA